MRSKINLVHYECQRAFGVFKAMLHKILKERVTYVIVVIAAIFLIIWLYAPQLPIFLPNVLGIRNVSAGIALLSTIIGSLAAILGIVIAVMLVAFEILRKTYSAYAFKSFFQDTRLKEIFSIYASTIIVSVLTLASLSDPLNSRDIDLIYLSLLLFAGSLIILFPYSQKIIGSTQSKKRIEDILEKIDGAAIRFFRLSTHSMVTPVLDDSGRYEVVTSIIEENPIYILKEVAVRSLKDDDLIIPRFVLAESTRKLLAILKNVDERDKARDTINVFLIIIRGTARQAIKSRQEGILYAILGAIEGIHSFCAENKLPWYVVIELNNALVEIIEETIKSDLTNVSKYGLYTIERIMKAHLEKNTPSEDEIWTLHIYSGEKVQHDTNKSLQWQDVSDRYIRMVSNLTETAIDLQKSEVVNTGLFVLENIASEAMNLDLGDRQKTPIIRWCYYYIEKSILKSVEEGLYSKGAVRPIFYGMDAALEKKAKFSNIPLITFSKILIQLAEKNSLDSFILNDLGTLGRDSITKVEENTIYKDSVLYIIKVFDKIKNITEKNLNEENKQIYVEINTQLNSFTRWMESSTKKNCDVEIALDKILNSFDKLDQIKREYEKDMITWGN